MRDIQIKDLKGPAQDSTEEGILTYNADFVKITIDNDLAGYACIGTYDHFKDTILEYYLNRCFRSYSGEILKLLAKQYKCNKWLVNTHDFFAFPVMLELELAYMLDAFKFGFDQNTCYTQELFEKGTLKITRSYEITEVHNLILQDGFYTGKPQSLINSIETEELYSLRADNALIGAGFIGVLSRTPTYADIAMIIDEIHRNKGWGTLLVKELVFRCKERGIIPTAICDANNKASRKTLERSGFYLDGCLLLANL